LLFPSQHAYLEAPVDPDLQRMLVLNDRMRFARKATDQVAGRACTVWEVGDPGDGASACITDDGVLLRGEGGKGKSRRLLVATSVQYGAQPGSLFAPPADYHRIAPSFRLKP
jgi:hypothetical protein